MVWKQGVVGLDMIDRQIGIGRRPGGDRTGKSVGRQARDCQLRRDALPAQIVGNRPHAQGGAGQPDPTQQQTGRRDGGEQDQLAFGRPAHSRTFEALAAQGKPLWRELASGL